MGVKYTEEQQQVINLRNRNILVSAAAGSGKTAVLVERIITRLTKDIPPIDIDQLLVVTYTEAAASEMKERIRSAIESALENNPQDSHLQRQATLVHSARITTIHSFCLSVIRDYFHCIDLDPGFRIGEEGELKLLRHDVLDELLESCYENGDKEFLDFVECFASGKDDKKIEELILQLYEFSRSFPNPGIWFEKCIMQYDMGSAEAMEENAFIQGIMKRCRKYFVELEENLELAIEACGETDGPYMYRDALEDDLHQIRLLMRAGTFKQIHSLISDIKWKKFAPNRDRNVSERLSDYVKAIREEVKKTISSVTEQYFFDYPEELYRDMKSAKRNLKVLVRLTEDFANAFSDKKRSRNMIDFSDMERFALQILTKEENGERVPSVVAEEYQERFAEVMIDEYQDSNLIQEAILTSVSTVSKGINNVFMVGDVKQSIYRFRLSRPELFMEKFDTYSLEESQEQRIDLHKNFRSRREVLDSVNFIFEQIMTRGVGGVQYDEKAALYVGASYAEQSGNETEVLLIDTDVDESEDMKIEETNRELEARAVTRRIKELVGRHPVLDKATGEYRPAKYADIVILTRSLKGWTDVFTRILNREGIPAHSGSKAGYFQTKEVRTLLNYLKVLDNPRQDIPFVAVLTSSLGRVTNEELAEIKSSTHEKTFYERVSIYSVSGGKKELCQKLQQFLKQIEYFRKKIPYTAIHALLWNIIEETGYGNYVASMPSGEQRVANLEMLVEKAVSFESTSYKGLFHFVRYIEQLHKYDVDYGEANVIDEQADIVRLMSIHKSKGLEFPIVFVSGMSKKFNTQDVRGSIIIHPELGIGIDAVDLERRTKAPTLIRKVLQNEITMENLGEELRVLYVALTRAKEKLIMTGTVSNMEEKLKKYETLRKQEKPELPFGRLTKAGSYFDWILPALYRHASFAGMLEEYGLEVPFANPLFTKEVPIICRKIHLEDIVREEVVEEVKGKLTKDILRRWDANQLYNQAVRDQLEEQLEYSYPYQEEQGIKQKMTVSELKKRIYLEEEGGEQLFEEPEVIPLLPRFLQEEAELSGASRGSAYHRLLELLDFSKEYNEKNLREALQRIQEKGLISEEMAGCINVSDILEFLVSSVGQRVQEAAKHNQLWTEQPFVLGVDASEVYKEHGMEEPILVQGIIDVYFEEDGELVVLDYKTDRIYSAKEFKERYHAQLDYYAKALERLTGKNVKEKLIYSFAMHREIEV